jgi:hypothetical protein
MSSFLNNKNFQLGILITLACLVVLLISLNHKSMGFEISILAVIAVILLTTYLVIHILGNNNDSTTAAEHLTDYTENFDCGKNHKDALPENFANPVEDYQNMEQFQPNNEPIQQLSGQMSEDEGMGAKPVFKTNASGALNIDNIARQLEETEADNISRKMNTAKQRAEKRLEGAIMGDVVRDQHADITDKHPAPDGSETCGNVDGPGGEGVCLFEISTRDTCINRNSYDIRGTCHIENKGPLPAPQPPKCPCDSTAPEKWKANMCKTLGNGVGCDSGSQDKCDELWDNQYGVMFNTAGKDNDNNCWRNSGGLTEKQCGKGGPLLQNDLMPRTDAAR